MKLNERILGYTNQIESIKIELERLGERAFYLPALRFALFGLVIVLFYKYLITSIFIYIDFAAFSLISFLFLTWWDNHLKKKIERFNRMIQICTNEINAINGDYTPFDPGQEYIDPDHSYSYDLDLFGISSLFQSINRSVTIFGKNRLAVYLKDAFHFKNQLVQRQEAILELSEQQDIRHKMQLVFYGELTSEKDRRELTDWLESENKLLDNKIVNSVRYVLPILTNSLIVLSVMGFVTVQIPVLMFILQLFIIALVGRKTIKIHSLLTSKVKTISKYAQFLHLIEVSKFKSQYINDLKRKLSNEEGVPPSKIIRDLYLLLNRMDSNLNILVSLLLNGLFLFNLQLLVAVEKWKSRYSKVIPLWFETIGEIDAMASLANFSANNPDFIFPVATENEYIFEATDLGHPLIPNSECVTNDISISGWNQYCIITGANMSGKSTFLRTVGINYILAMLGAPVFATRFVFTPVILQSSIRTSDSLAKKESFFYAELKRLQAIISKLESGQRTFILLDEILKGTNSKDKQVGSLALLEQLIKYESVGLIATHDLILGDLIREYPENIHNLCFEIQIVENEMSIDYKLQKGVCQNLNATFLMKKMGILVNN